jgi:hypothetical protein
MQSVYQFDSHMMECAAPLRLQKQINDCRDCSPVTRPLFSPAAGKHISLRLNLMNFYGAEVEIFIFEHEKSSVFIFGNVLADLSCHFATDDTLFGPTDAVSFGKCVRMIYDTASPFHL